MCFMVTVKLNVNGWHLINNSDLVILHMSIIMACIDN